MRAAKQTLIRYLLGELPAAEQTTLEQEYFADPQLFDQLVEAENDLIDEYARGRLSPETRRRFEQYYLAHSKRRERSRFAQVLAARLDRAGELPSAAIPTESWLQRLLTALQGPKLAWSFAVALVLLIAGVAWFALQTRHLHQELAKNEAERNGQEQHQKDLQQQLGVERSRADQLAGELARARSETTRPTATPSNTPAPMLATLVLSITGLRGAEAAPAAVLNIPPGTEEARIQLNLKDNDYSNYSVVIQSADGKQIFKRDGLQSKGKPRASLVVTLPASKLSTGDYILTLKGVTQTGDVEDLSKSFFRVSQNRPR